MSDTEKPKSWQERRRTIKHKWLIAFIFSEWLCERISYLLEQWAFLDILGHVGRLTILIAVIFYFMEADERRLQSTSLQMQVENLGLQLRNQKKAEHYQAWQVINTAQGKPGSGGRIDALQDLNKDGISLANIDLSLANLQSIDLKKAILTNANLTEVNLTGADFRGANLIGADLSRADLTNTNLTSAYLQGANLSEATLTENTTLPKYLFDVKLCGVDLTGADLSSAILIEADLTRANLTYANLAGAHLIEADLSSANLAGTNLSGANIHMVNFVEANFVGANIHSVKNPPDGFIEWAKKYGAVSIENEDDWKKSLNKNKRWILLR
ncbi:MAG: pentapeptide repeat-containing protein [Planctomycetes bacterium]|nr:pentapeptide repeat-containing protein [Planctomycetota bacterium]